MGWCGVFVRLFVCMYQTSRTYPRLSTGTVKLRVPYLKRHDGTDDGGTDRRLIGVSGRRLCARFEVSRSATPTHQRTHIQTYKQTYTPPPALTARPCCAFPRRHLVASFHIPVERSNLPFSRRVIHPSATARARSAFAGHPVTLRVLRLSSNPCGVAVQDFQRVTAGSEAHNATSTERGQAMTRHPQRTAAKQVARFLAPHGPPNRSTLKSLAKKAGCEGLQGLAKAPGSANVPL